MALLFMDGFDNYNSMTIAALGKWQTYVQTTNSVLSISAGNGRFGSAALDIVYLTNKAYLQGVLATPLPRVIIGFALNVIAFEPTNELPLFSYVDVTTTQVTVSVLPNGQIRFRSGDFGTILATSNASVITSTGTFFFLELDITFNSATGAIVLHSNGVNVPLSASSGLNTAPSGNNSFNTYRLGFPNNGGGNSVVAHYRVDDFYLVSATGGTNTTMLGDVRVVTVFPTGPGSSTQFTPNGAGTNWQCVNETSEDGDTTYVSDPTIGQKDLYAHGATPVNTGQVFGVQLDSVARKDDAAGRNIANTLLSGATAQDGASQALSQSYAWYLDIFENDPNTSAPWTKSSVDASQIGVKVAA